MGDSFFNSLKHLLQQTGYDDIDSVDFDYYEEIPHEGCGLNSVLEFLTLQITDDNCIKKEHLEVAEELKTENTFLDEVKSNKKLKCASQLDALPPITEVDIDCCKSELFELKKQLEVLQNLKGCLNIEFEELKKISEVNEQWKTKCDVILNRTISQCKELNARYDSVHEIANNSFKLYKSILKDMRLNRKDFSFQISIDTRLRTVSTVFKNSLRKMMRKIGLPPQFSDLNTSCQSDASFHSNALLEAYNRIFNTEFIDEFEKNKLELKLFCVKLQQTSYLKTMKFIEKDSFTTVLKLLRKMNGEIQEGSLQLAVLRDDIQDIAQLASELPGGWGDENSTDELTSAVDVVCEEWMKYQMFQHSLNRFDQRAIRREHLFEQLNSFINFLQPCLAFDDMIWMILVLENICISSFIEIYRSTMNQSSKELAGFKKRMKIMWQMLENNSIEQPEESLGSIGNILFHQCNDGMNVNKISTTLDESVELFDGIGSKFLSHISRLSKVLDSRCKEITSFNRFILSESGDFIVDDNEMDNIQSRIGQLVENIEILSKLVDDKRKYFESKPYEKDYILAWALFLTNKEKLKEVAEKVEREATKI